MNEKGRFMVDIHTINENIGNLNLSVIDDWNEFVEGRLNESLYVTISDFVIKKLKYLQNKYDVEVQRLNNDVSNLKKELNELNNHRMVMEQHLERNEWKMEFDVNVIDVCLICILLMISLQIVLYFCFFTD